MRTSGRDPLKALGQSTAALVCGLMLASCTSGEPEAKNEQPPCGISPSSQEGVLLRDVIAADAFDALVYNSTSEVVATLRRALPETGPEHRIPMRTRCALWAVGQDGGGGVTFRFGWVSRASKEVQYPLPNGVPFEVEGGTFGQANDVDTTLYVGCEMPGELGEASKSAWFHAKAEHSVSSTPAAVDQAARDRQTALTYLMARRITEALGCENKPLEKPPVVKPLPSP
ncbi:hypothetical protein J7E97_31385 [Streptomyces sp. ISL-66]|uniref:hypothetical protein n=1 Tax=Streptomyces sp. ISL-66 TaxID=2819186 RepID=UPI001BE8B1E1|nr:hypothetical protein [Streptomyces sp. ISL-66]MBT2472239.1 hypothetical protein [Streptomyces sp. ISL-66]